MKKLRSEGKPQLQHFSQQVNKTPFSGWYIAGKCPRLKDCPKNEQLAEKRRFDGNCEILRRVFQLRALSSDIPASRKGIYLFYNPPINFSWRTLGDRKAKKRSHRYVHGF